jgi:hypothetical protein
MCSCASSPLITLRHLHLSLPATLSLSSLTFVFPSLQHALYSLSHPSILLFLISYTCLCHCLCLLLSHHSLLSLTTASSLSHPLQVPTDAQLTIVEPEDQHLKTVIDMTAQFISADGEVFEKVQNTLPLAFPPINNNSSPLLFTFPFFLISLPSPSLHCFILLHLISLSSSSSSSFIPSSFSPPHYPSPSPSHSHPPPLPL